MAGQVMIYHVELSDYRDSVHYRDSILPDHLNSNCMEHVQV